jgi:hypothetical protein
VTSAWHRREQRTWPPHAGQRAQPTVVSAAIWCACTPSARTTATQKTGTVRSATARADENASEDIDGRFVTKTEQDTAEGTCLGRGKGARREAVSGGHGGAGEGRGGTGEGHGGTQHAVCIRARQIC